MDRNTPWVWKNCASWHKNGKFLKSKLFMDLILCSYLLLATCVCMCSHVQMFLSIKVYVHMYVYSQDHDIDNLHDGMYKGVQYFLGKGRFVKLTLLEPDRRILEAPAPSMQCHFCIMLIIFTRTSWQFTIKKPGAHKLNCFNTV